MRRLVWVGLFLLAASIALVWARRRINYNLSVRKFYAVVTQPWDEMTADADFLPGNRLLASRGTRLIVLKPGIGRKYETESALEIGEFVHRILTRGSLAFVVAGREGLLVIDVSEPASPRIIGRLAGRGYGYDIALHGNHALVASREGGYFLADISNPSQPRLITSQRGRAPGVGAAFSGDRAWISIGGLGVLEARGIGDDAGAPGRFFAGPPMETISPDPPPFDLVTAGPTVLVAYGERGLGIIRSSPAGAGSISWSTLRIGYARGLDLDGHILCVADYTGFIVRARLDPLGDAEEVSRVETGGTPIHARCRGQRMLVARGAQGVAVYSLAGPTASELIGEYVPEAFTHSMTPAGENLVVGRGSEGVAFFRRNKNGTSSEVSRIPVVGTAQHTEIGTGRAYVAEVTGGLSVWDIHEILHPKLLDRSDLSSRARQAIDLGDRLIALAGESPVGLLTSDPAGRLHRDAALKVEGYGWRALAVDRRVWAGFLHGGIGFLSVTPGGALHWKRIRKGNLRMPMSFARAGPFVHVGDMTGIATYRLRSSGLPRFLGVLSISPGYPMNMAEFGGRLYVAAHSRGLLVLDIVNGRPSRIAAECPTRAPLAALAAAPDGVWIAPGSETPRRIDPFGGPSSGCTVFGLQP